MQGVNNNKNVAKSRDASSNIVRQISMVTSKNRDFMQGPLETRMSPTAGMPAATWCARNSMDTSQNRDFMQGTNSIRNVANSRDASRNMVRQKQHGHKRKQGLDAGSKQH
jgi:hypothetical protein